ncbi:hypothetical protein IT402_01450 [Candidatus Nomurabacteria bacterium]|nr:hypothetical protein [Candidatus Nomurabacteria bacterium]
MKSIFKLFIFIIFFNLYFSTSSVFATENFVISAPKEVSVGESFNVSIFVNSPSQAINAVSGVIGVSGGVTFSKINRESNIINFWTSDPKIVGNQIRFEGIVLNPGYQGNNGFIFSASMVARKEGVATLSFSEGSILANDGLGSNVIDYLSSLAIKIKVPSIKVDPIPQSPIAIITTDEVTGKKVALPVITDYPESIDHASRAYIRGKGEPNALTKLTFKDVSVKSLGEQFIDSLQPKKNKPTEALIKNDEDGFFQYLSAENLVAGAYNITPFLVDEEQQTQKPGFGARILVNNSPLVKWLVVLINVLALLIPVVCLLIIIYFIPWYSRLRMKILNHKIQLEDEQLKLSEKEIKKKEDNINLGA